MNNFRKLNPLVEELLSKRNTLLNEDGAELRARRSEEARLRKAGILKPNEELPSAGKKAGEAYASPAAREAYKKGLENFRQWGLGKLMDLSDISGWTEVAPYTPLSIAASEYAGAGVEELGRAESEMKEKFPGKYKELRDTLVQDLVKERKAAFDEGDKSISEKDLLTRVISKNKDLADVLTRDEYETVAGGITNPLRIETEDAEGNKSLQVDLPRWTGIGKGAANVYDVGAGAADVLTDPVQLGTAIATGGAFNLATRGAGTLGAKVAAGLVSRAPAGTKAAAEAAKRFLPPALARARSAEELGKAVGRTTVAVGGAGLVVPSAVEAASQDKLARWSGEMLGSAAPFVLGSKLVDKAIAAYNKSITSAKPKAEPEVSPKPETAKDIEVSGETKFEIPPSGTYSAKEMPKVDFGAAAKPAIEVSPRPDWANTGEMLKSFGYLPNIYKATKGRQGAAFTSKIPEPVKTEVSKPLEPIEVSREKVDIPLYEPPAVGSERVDSGIKPNVPIVFWRPQEQIGGEGKARERRRRRPDSEVSPKPEEPVVSVPETPKSSEIKVDFNAPATPPIPEYSRRPDYANTGEILRAFGLKPEIYRATRGRQGGAFTAQIPEPAPLPKPRTTLPEPTATLSSDVKAIEQVGRPPESILSRAAREAREASAKPKEIPAEAPKPEISAKPPEELTPEQMQDLLKKLSPIPFQFPSRAPRPSLARVAAAATAVPGAGANLLPPQTTLADLLRIPRTAEVRPSIEISTPKWATETKPIEIINGEQIGKAVADMAPQMRAPAQKPAAEKPATPRAADEVIPASSKPDRVTTKPVETATLQEPSVLPSSRRPSAVSAPSATPSVPARQEPITDRDREAPELVEPSSTRGAGPSAKEGEKIQVSEPSVLPSSRRPSAVSAPSATPIAPAKQEPITDRDRQAPELVEPSSARGAGPSAKEGERITIEEPKSLVSVERPAAIEQPKIQQAEPKTVFDMMRDMYKEFEKNKDLIQNKETQQTKEEQIDTARNETAPATPAPIIIPKETRTVSGSTSSGAGAQGGGEKAPPPPKNIGRRKEKGKPPRAGIPSIGGGGEGYGSLEQGGGFKLGANVNLGARALGRFTQYLHI